MSRVAWRVLLVLSIALAVNHVVVALVVDDGDTLAVTILAVANVASAAVLLGPVRKGHRAAAGALWVQVLLTSSVLVWGDDPTIKAWYAGITVALALPTLALTHGRTPVLSR